MEISLKSEVIKVILGFPITNSLILSLSSAFIIIVGSFLIVRSLKLIPSKIQNGFEIIVEAILDFMSQTLGDRELAKKFFPVVAAIFLFILLNNWLGVLPGTGSIGLNETHNGKEVFVPFFRSANSDLNTTIALALIAMAAVQIYGIKKFGFSGYFSKFITLKKGPIYFFVGILELISELSKIISFSFRLFGNIFAGEVLLLIVMNLAPLFAPFPFVILEFFVGFIQALVFAMLTMMFLKVATETAH